MYTALKHTTFLLILEITEYWRELLTNMRIFDNNASVVFYNDALSNQGR